jgi:folate-binding Fe-S cluster repair protein YgfZ
LEAGAERSVARNKGCYPGQEVIERIFTYGQVNRKLMPVDWQGEPPTAAAPIALQAEGKTEAQLVSWERDPAEPFRGVGLAYVRRSHWEFTGPWSGPDGLTAVLRR